MAPPQHADRARREVRARLDDSSNVHGRCHRTRATAIHRPERLGRIRPAFAILSPHMAKRRTSGIQRRQRASTEALSRRVDASARAGLPLDWRILLIGGVLLIGAIILVVVLVVGAGPNPYAGVRQAFAGQTHVSPGTDVRATQPGAYTSLPATSGPHWEQSAIANWGVYTAPLPESQVVHNLEHGGIVIWYQQGQVSDSDLARLADYVEGQVAQGIGGRFKFIFSPWGGEDFGHPIAVTAWEFLLYLDTADLDAIRGFADSHYGDAPEPNGGPAP
jgi:hypothetical protein